MQVWNGHYVSNGGPVARVDATKGVTAKVLYQGTITSSVNSATFFLENANAILFYWEIDAISGSGASLTVLPQCSVSQAGSYTQFLTSSAQTAVGSGTMCTVLPLSGGAVENWVRLNLTVAGTTPSVTLTVYAVPFYIGPNA